jgi:myo-inositol 2-dehydrogenase/D-chiro-inositol 1-dehydrogenase
VPAFPVDMQHLVDCVANDLQPLVTGDDGRAVTEIVFATYEGAGAGSSGPSSL